MIPPLIHKIMIVDGGKPAEFTKGIEDAIQTFRDKNPFHTLKIYSGNDCETFIKKHYEEEILECYHAIKPYAYKSDFFRYLLLYRLGGWYSDIRQVALASFDDLDKEFYCAADAPPNQLCMYNAIIGCVPNHPIMKKVIDMCVFNIKQKHYGLDCLYITGPGVLMSACIDFIRKEPTKYGIGKHIIDRDGAGYVCFEKKLFIKNKYNNAKGADNSDVSGTNNYGKMWVNWQVY